MSDLVYLSLMLASVCYLARYVIRLVRGPKPKITGPGDVVPHLFALALFAFVAFHVLFIVWVELYDIPPSR